MNTLPYPIVVNLIIEWPALAFVNKYTYGIYIKYIKKQGCVTVEYYLNPCNTKLRNMCKKGKYIEIFKDNLDWNQGLFGACEGDYLDIINLMIEKGADDLNWGFSNACRGGHLNLVNLMIEKGANAWDWGLKCACKGGNLDIVNLMIEKGAYGWNLGLESACEEGYLNIVKLMIEKGADECLYCFNKRHEF